MAPFTARSHSSASSILTTLELPGGTRAFPRWRERSRCTCAHETQQQTEAIQHILARRDAPSTAVPGARPQSARRCGRPPASSRAAPRQAESTPRPARRASRRRGVPRIPARPQVIQKVDEAALTRATRRCWNLLFLRRQREQRRSFPRWRAGRIIFCFRFVSVPPLVQRSAVPTFSKKEQFPFPPGS